MKALSLHPYWADFVFSGGKTVECRTWKTDYRGELLICSTNKKWRGCIPGHALCTAKLVDIVPFTEKHLKAACMLKHEMPDTPCYAWILEDVRIIRPFPVKGKLGLWNYDGPIEYLEEPATEEEDKRMYHEIWEPLEV